MEPLDIKVQCINNRYHIRLYDKQSGSVVDEMACKDKCDIGYVCSEMLRWADKLGYVSPMAQASRKRRIKKMSLPIGKIWYNKDIPIKQG